MRYAYVENGKVIDGPRAIPNAWRNISGLCFMSPDELKLLGWLPWHFVEVSPPSNHKPSPSKIEIKDNEIVETQQWCPKTEEDIASEIANHNIEMDRRRAEAYKNESDPIFFKWQRNEATEEEWLTKVTEIKERFPK